MHSTKVRWAFLTLAVLIGGTSVFANETDDYVPEVTDRVARVSFVQGDVQIRRAESQDWEVVVLNLPIVEGDEIATDGNGRFEIQFNSHTHLRVAENSQIKILSLKDEGIAISVPLGTISLRANELDSGRSYFEIDAPKTTVSIQKSGMYRVEAGVPDSLEVFVSALDGGEARVYSSDAGFTIKNGRRAKIFIAGSQLGEWETADATQLIDEFDKWTFDRDEIIAQRLRDAHYDRYYDRDIYGAEDLNDHGEWVYTRKYGYVWRPYRNSINQYSDWSPYRYGQ
ncbi:MAG TPA: FecR domain-containing protein, partial [Pyrinomonadaceae bacterium]